MDSNLKKFEEHLNKISLLDWQKLFRLIPEIEAAINFGTLKGGDTNPDGTFNLHYWEESKLVKNFLKIINQLQLMVVFDWAAGRQGRGF